MMKIEKIGVTIHALLDTLGLADIRKSALIFSRWKDIAGEQLFGKVEPERYRRGILHLSVSSHSWSQELQFLKPQFIEKINSFLGEEVVKDIRFKVRGR